MLIMKKIYITFYIQKFHICCNIHIGVIVDQHKLVVGFFSDNELQKLMDLTQKEIKNLIAR